MTSFFIAFFCIFLALFLGGARLFFSVACSVGLALFFSSIFTVYFSMYAFLSPILNALKGV